jgi:hypothetical protein
MKHTIYKYGPHPHEIRRGSADHLPLRARQYCGVAVAAATKVWDIYCPFLVRIEKGEPVARGEKEEVLGSGDRTRPLVMWMKSLPDTIQILSGLVFEPEEGFCTWIMGKWRPDLRIVVGHAMLPKWCVIPVHLNITKPGGWKEEDEVGREVLASVAFVKEADFGVGIDVKEGITAEIAAFQKEYLGEKIKEGNRNSGVYHQFRKRMEERR